MMYVSGPQVLSSDSILSMGTSQVFDCLYHVWGMIVTGYSVTVGWLTHFSKVVPGGSTSRKDQTRVVLKTPPVGMTRGHVELVLFPSLVESGVDGGHPLREEEVGPLRRSNQSRFSTRIRDKKGKGKEHRVPRLTSRSFVETRIKSIKKGKEDGVWVLLFEERRDNGTLSRNV